MGIWVGVDVGVDVDMDVGVGVRVGVGVGVGVDVGGVVVGLGVGVGPATTAWGVGVIAEIGGRVATGTMTSVPTGVKINQEGGVITSGRSGSICSSPVVVSSGFSSESILAGTSHARFGLIATCAVHRRQTNPSSSIRKNTSKSRRRRSRSSAGSRPLSRLLWGSFAVIAAMPTLCHSALGSAPTCQSHHLAHPAALEE